MEMEKLLNLISQHPRLMLGLGFMIILVIVIVFFVLRAVYRDGREISIPWLNIGKKESEQKDINLMKTQTEHTAQSEPRLHTSIAPNLYLYRKLIHWQPYNEKAYNRFWACGTSLIGVSERGLIQNFLEKRLKDIKILLPNTKECFSSFHQLDLYDRLEDSDLVLNQVHAANESYKRLYATIDRFARGNTEDYIRIYSGIMYSNITIFDEDAFISFYDSTGIGDNNNTLYFNKQSYEKGYHFVEEEFLRMWNSDPNFGMIRKKKKGVSIIFINHAGQILLFLRDQKDDIPYPNYWDVLGGNVEDGETPQQCILREMKEEIEFDLRNPILFNVYDMDDRIEYTFWQKIDFDISTIRLHEGQRLKWFSEDDIKAMNNTGVAFGFRNILLDFFRAKPFE